MPSHLATSTFSQQSKQQLRTKLKQQRRQLTHKQQQQASLQVIKQLKRLPNYQFAKRVALYISAYGELPTAPIIKDLQQRQRACFVPVIDPVRPHCMRFMRLHKTSKLQTHRLGMLQPKFVYAQCVPTFSLSLMLLPLLAFDTGLQRLGMGGGFYDRALAKAAKARQLNTIGLGYEWQKHTQLPSEKWDRPLNYIVSDAQIYTQDVIHN